MLQDLKYEENSVKAVQCLNDMVTNALIHVEDCLKYMSALRDPAIFRFCAIPQVEMFLCGFLYFRPFYLHYAFLFTNPAKSSFLYDDGNFKSKSRLRPCLEVFPLVSSQC